MTEKSCNFYGMQSKIRVFVLSAYFSSQNISSVVDMAPVFLLNTGNICICICSFSYE